MEKALQFLTDLEHNNNREYCHANRDRLNEANAAFLRLLEQMVLEIGAFDPSVLGCNVRELTMKMNRDTRFSHDKSPYNPKLRAHISPGGRMPIPAGYFVVIAPGGRSFLGGGLFAAIFKDATTMIRDRIVKDSGAFEAILADPEFSSRFEVKGEKLKNVPPGYDKEHPLADYLKFKSWYLEYFVPDSEVISEGFVKEAAAVFKAMKPFNDFLNGALEGFQMPPMPR